MKLALVTETFPPEINGFAPLRRLTLAWLRHVHNRTRCTFAPTEELCRELAGLTETFGNVLTEAMASGLAITGFDYAAAR